MTKIKYILIKKDVVESGNAKVTKSGQLQLKNCTKIPKSYYVDLKGNKLFLFMEEISHSVKFDFSMFPEYTDQIKQEVINIEKDSDFVMSHIFTKGILDIDKEQRMTLILLLFGGILGGLGIGVVFGIVIHALF